MAIPNLGGSWRYDRAELWADGAIHVLGVALALAGAVAMLRDFLPNMPAATSISSGVYLASLVTALGLSAVYNIWPVSPTKWFLRRFDHSAIYLLIAGTYTPFAMHMGDRALPLLTFVWGVAAVGILLKLSCRAVSTGCRSCFIWRSAGAASWSMTRWCSRCRPWCSG